MRLFRVSDDQNELSSSLFVAFREDEEAVIGDQKFETEKRPRTHIVARCRGHGCIWRCVNPCFDAPSFSVHAFFLCLDNIASIPLRVTAIFLRLVVFRKRFFVHRRTYSWTIESAIVVFVHIAEIVIRRYLRQMRGIVVRGNVSVSRVTPNFRD